MFPKQLLCGSTEDLQSQSPGRNQSPVRYLGRCFSSIHATIIQQLESRKLQKIQRNRHWRLVPAMQQVEQKLNNSPTIDTHRKAVWNTPKEFQHHWRLTNYKVRFIPTTQKKKNYSEKRKLAYIQVLLKSFLYLGKTHWLEVISVILVWMLTQDAWQTVLFLFLKR